MDETTSAQSGATESPVASGQASVGRFKPLLPGLLAGLLFLALVTREGLLGAAAGPVIIVLALLLAGSLVAQPPVLAALRRVRSWPGLAEVAAVAAVVLLGAGLRFWGLGFGLPYLEHPDEWAVADRAVHMLQSGDYSPHAFIYPTLYTYLQVAVAGLHFLWGVSAGLYHTLDQIELPRYYAWGRTLTALLGTASVLLTYVLGRIAYRRSVGLLAAAFLAVYPAAAGDAHYITTDTPSMFFTLLALLPITWLGLTGTARGDQPARAGVSSENNQRRSYYALAVISGLAVGLATATKYNVAVLVIPLAVAVVFGRPRSVAGMGAAMLISIAGLWALLGILIGFTLGMPLWPREVQQILNDIASVIVHYRFTGHPGAESSKPALFYWDAFASNGALLAWAFLGGTLLAFVRHRRADVLLLAFAVPYFIQMVGVKVVFFRNTMPLLPVLCILAGSAVVTLATWLTDWWVASRQRGRTFSMLNPQSSMIILSSMIIGAILVAQPLAIIVSADRLRAAPTTRNLATEWIEREAPDGTRIWLEDQTLILPERLRVAGGHPLTNQALAWFKQNGFRFMVANEDERRGDLAVLDAFGTPVARFAPDGERLGPVLRIYDTGYGDPSGDERTSSGATLGAGAITLDGYHHATEAKAGTRLPLALYWKAMRTVPQDYTVYVHLLDAQGNTVAQRDLPPLDGQRPTSRWKAGELLRDDQDLDLPANLAPGTYRLVVGMYDPQTLAAINDSGPIEVGAVTIK